MYLSCLGFLGFIESSNWFILRVCKILSAIISYYCCYLSLFFPSGFPMNVRMLELFTIVLCVLLSFLSFLLFCFSTTFWVLSPALSFGLQILASVVSHLLLNLFFLFLYILIWNILLICYWVFVVVVLGWDFNLVGFLKISLTWIISLVWSQCANSNTCSLCKSVSIVCCIYWY